MRIRFVVIIFFVANRHIGSAMSRHFDELTRDVLNFFYVHNFVFQGSKYFSGLGIKRVNMVCMTVASTSNAVLLSTCHIKNLEIVKTKDSLKSEPPSYLQNKKIKLVRSYYVVF
jgi:hypothetical protein